MVIEDFRNIEFGICTIIGGQQTVLRIPIDNSVRTTLYDMHESFYKAYFGIEEEPELFQPSEKYGSTEKLFVPLSNENLASLREIYNQNDIPIVNMALGEIANSISFYFAIFRHNNGSKQIAVKRPSQFKGLLRKKLIYLIDDTLQVIPDNIFKLDNDFDFIIHENNIDILHPTGFNFIANIDEEVLRSAADSTRQLSVRIQFINFNYLADFVGHSKTAAKLIASIKSRTDLERTSQVKLMEKCIRIGVNIREENGQILPEEDDIVRFLEILDRRGYDFDITEDLPEIYVASSRRRVN
ncbi:hypothetical protein DMZ43_07585 [Meridianimaribacter sp. CL38]|uniref:Kiwa anti-phage protein KwaB-like domain-containing protein n=1 Tax=Meridianimaribacter sp. CL38 TaxID=2213021 RepID=UPI00103AE897|nr:Kiwa anti-phage protein KwaB-like domain-containing protein [Meridianimaribacter sp. CL38]TBV26915.1 hypothetical protein DMZ43_07585 [Meridianimaribacter sp. CL38]